MRGGVRGRSGEGAERWRSLVLLLVSFVAAVAGVVMAFVIVAVVVVGCWMVVVACVV